MPVANPPYAGIANADDRITCAVVIFAKAPLPGRCKTRLARGVGNRRAARLYAAMLEHAVARVTHAAPARVVLACAPDTRHPLFMRLARRYPIQRYRQSGGDLGTRMASGIRLGLRQASRVVLMGSDQPCLEGQWLAQACRALHEHDVWLAPTVDGGYWAIGLSRTQPRVFRGPHWSTPRVAKATRTAMQRLSLVRAELDPRDDIDTLRDWQRLNPDLRRRLAHRAAMPGVDAID